MSLDENVLCLPTEQLDSVGSFLGFRPLDDALAAIVMNPKNHVFRWRREAENDPKFKQLIPYVVMRWGNSVFTYIRGASGTEKRLTALRSLGIGGHITEEDAAGGDDPYRAGMLREVEEETRIDTPYQEQLLGVVRDDRTVVGSVHLGVVHLFTLESTAVTVCDSALVEAGFMGLAEVDQRRQEFETWSQFVLEALK